MRSVHIHIKDAVSNNGEKSIMVALETKVDDQIILIAQTQYGPKIIPYDPERMSLHRERTPPEVPEGFQEALENFLVAQRHFLSIAEPCIAKLEQAYGPL
jgi:hypothetical protein